MNDLDKINLGTFRKDIKETDENDQDSVRDVFEKQKDFFCDLTKDNAEYKKSFLYAYISGDINSIMDPTSKIERINKLSKVLEVIRDDEKIDEITKDKKYDEWIRLMAEVVLRDVEDNNGGLRPQDLELIQNKNIIQNLKMIISEINEYTKYSYGDEIYQDAELGSVYSIEQNKEKMEDYFFDTINLSDTNNIENKKLIFYSILNGKINSKIFCEPNSIQKVAIINQVTKILKEWKDDNSKECFNEREYLEWKKIISEVVLRDIQDQWGGVMKKDFSKIDPEIKNEICEIIKNKNNKIYEYISYIN
ncbi:MAG: hypothetical protein QMB51_02060 [Patescibacteria group bacterium]